MTTQRVLFAGNIIETTVTDKASVAEDWVSDIRSRDNGDRRVIVGLDCEWRPHPIRYMSNTTATLQLCINDKCLILQLFYMDYIPQSIKDFLNDPTFTFVGVEVADDAAKLRNEYGLTCNSTADLRALAKRHWPGRFRRPSLKDLASEVVGLYMAKPRNVTMSNWENR
ncbi:Werner Syndrome-like exonuclease [Macadamia integrifolia]|uniref:Werner Syndrome-like exonuclease n=1 Tax=Macadamia integrifolia TaxID=60698 RepID=UPI001C4F2E1F|nr:Werner Syndrome-like exonuclease [Macadamia integrifolia]XP_042499124.1 Werner Syndrome-like exonuclease [Macadamia integrifolia]